MCIDGKNRVRKNDPKKGATHMAFITLDDARKDIRQLRAHDSVAFQTKDGRVRIGTVRIKEVRCGKKSCTKCPHEIYAYAQYRVGVKVTEKYIGVMR